MTPRPRISAFPKCYLEELSRGEMDLFEWITESKALGADGLEIYSGFLRQGEDENYVRSVRQAIEATGQTCSLFCFSPNFTHPDASERRAALTQQKWAIDVTAALGGSCCRVLSGQRYPEVTRKDGIRWVVENIEAALEHAQAKGVVLAMENHYKDGFWKYPEFAQKMDVFLEIVSQIDSPFFGVQYDPSNAVVAGDDPVELLERVKDRVVSVHASDRYLEPGSTLEDMRQSDGSLGYPKNLCHGVVGEGLNDYDSIFKILRSVEFTGWISIEDGMNGMDDMQASVQFLHRQIDKYYAS